MVTILFYFFFEWIDPVLMFHLLGELFLERNTHFH